MSPRERSAEDNRYTITICARIDLFTDLFTNLYFEVNRFLLLFSSLGHRALGLSREKRLARGGHGPKMPLLGTFLTQTPRSRSRACRRPPRAIAGTGPQLPSPASPFAHFVRRGAATLGPFAPAGLKPLTIGLGSRRLRRRHAARFARFAARPSPGPSGRAAGPPGHLRWPWRPFGEYLFGEYLIRRIASTNILLRCDPREATEARL